MEAKYMKDMFTMKEAIDLILNFYTLTQGYWEEEIKKYPEARKFVEAGFTKMDEEYDDLYKMNNEGEKLLHSYIKEISERFITFICKRGLEISEEDAATWFMDTYALDDIELGKDICWYICGNLHNYGYKTYKLHSSKKGIIYVAQKISKQ